MTDSIHWTPPGSSVPAETAALAPAVRPHQDKTREPDNTPVKGSGRRHAHGSLAPTTMAQQLARLERLVFRDGIDKARHTTKPTAALPHGRRAPGRMGSLTRPRDRHSVDDIDLDEVMVQLAELLPELDRVVCALSDHQQQSESEEEGSADKHHAMGFANQGPREQRPVSSSSLTTVPDVQEATLVALQSASIVDGLAAFDPHLSDDERALLRAAHLRARALLRAVFAGEYGTHNVDPARGLAPLFEKLERWPPSIPPGVLPTPAKPWGESEWNQLVTWLFRPEPPVELDTIVSLDSQPTRSVR